MLRSDAAKWLRFNRCLESNDDSINAQPEGKTKFLFPISLPARLLNRECIRNCEILQRNGSETTSTGIPASGESAFRFTAVLLKPRFTYPRAISFPRRALRVALVTHPASFPGAEEARSFIPGCSGELFTEINPHNRLLVCPDILIREITS